LQYGPIKHLRGNILARSATGNLTEQVVQSLGRAIVSGEYPVHSIFQVADLCTQFKASRTVMREAVKTLTAKGLVSSRASVGSIVQGEFNWNLSDPDVLDWFLHVKGNTIPLIREFIDFRMGIEPSAAALAATRGDAQAIAEIFKALDRMRAAERGEDNALDADVDFHVAILHASGNRFFINMRHTIDVALHISIRVTNRTKGVTLASIADHARIADAIKANDPEGAHQAMRELLTEAQKLLTGNVKVPSDI
jgi:DNA-binding FadR family transcriptional regulator